MTKRKSRKKQFNLNRGLIAVVLSIVTTVLLIVALVLESGLVFAATGLSTLATVAAVQAARKKEENDGKRKAAMPAKPPRVPASVKKPAPKEQTEPATGGVITCTETGKPIDDCSCATRHVATEDGAKRYGGPVGRPLGIKTKEKRARTTSRA